MPIVSYVNKLYVFSAPNRKAVGMLELAAYLALRAPLRIFDGGNHLNVLKIARILRKNTIHVDVLLEQIMIARAFTCHQIETMLSTASGGTYTTLVIDFLNTFYDESVKEAESHALLQACISHLRRLSSAAPVIVSVSPNPKPGSRAELLDTLFEAADHAWRFEKLSSQNLQPTLWN